MAQKTMGRGVLFGMLAGAFVVGTLFGSVGQRHASAQLKGMGSAVMQKAGESGGAMGAVSELGSSIVEMQEHVSGLQKNIDTLKKVQAALGVGK